MRYGPYNKENAKTPKYCGHYMSQVSFLFSFESTFDVQLTCLTFTVKVTFHLRLFDSDIFFNEKRSLHISDQVELF